MPYTDYHAKYFAYELTKRCALDNPEKLASALVDAQVDLNPHQIDAALFAFRSPFSTGALLGFHKRRNIWYLLTRHVGLPGFEVSFDDSSCHGLTNMVFVGTSYRKRQL